MRWHFYNCQAEKQKSMSVCWVYPPKNSSFDWFQVVCSAQASLCSFARVQLLRKRCQPPTCVWGFFFVMLWPYAKKEIFSHRQTFLKSLVEAALAASSRPGYDVTSFTWIPLQTPSSSVWLDEGHRGTFFRFLHRCLARWNSGLWSGRSGTFTKDVMALDLIRTFDSISVLISILL